MLDINAPLITRTTSSKCHDPWDPKWVLDTLRVKRWAERRFRETRSEKDYVKNARLLTKTLKASKLVAWVRSSILLTPHRYSRGWTISCINRRIIQSLNFYRRNLLQIISNFKDNMENIRQTFSDNLTLSQQNDTAFRGKDFERSIFNEVSLMIKSSKSKSCEFDPVPTTLLKQFITELNTLITCIVYL